MAVAQKPRQPRDRTVTDMRRFFNTLDFAALWDEYYSAVDSAGRLRWRSLWHFICNKTENAEQRQFLRWLLGPAEPVNETFNARWGSFAQPLDWKRKRETGGWFSEESLKAHSAAIRQKINALEALQAAGNGVTVNSLIRIERLAQQLDKEFGGQFFAPGLSTAANRERALLYVKLHGQLLMMLDRAQDIYAKSHGINFKDMSGFESLLSAQLMLNNRSGVVEESRAQKILEEIVGMTLEKGVKYKIPLPEPVESKIVDRVLSPDEAKRKLN